MEAAAKCDEGTSNVVTFVRRQQGLPPLQAEAARRIARLGYEQWRSRERATGLPVPPAILYLKMQIEFAAQALEALNPLPEDYRADGFWPG